MALCTRVENSTVCCPSSSAIALPAPPTSPSQPAPGAGGTTRVSIAAPNPVDSIQTPVPKGPTSVPRILRTQNRSPLEGRASDQSGEIAGEKAEENEAGERSRRKGKRVVVLIYKLAKSIGPRWIPFLAVAA